MVTESQSHRQNSLIRKQNASLLENLTVFYDSLYDGDRPKFISTSGLSFVISSKIGPILDNIRQNIDDNFINNLRLFISLSLSLDQTIDKDKINLIIKDLTSSENDKLKSNVEYHSWVKLQKKSIALAGVDLVIASRSNRLSLMRSYVYLRIQNLHIFMERGMPIKGNLFDIPQSLYTIVLCTRTLLSVYGVGMRKYRLSGGNILDRKLRIWDLIFNLSNSSFQKDNYVFNFKLKTNGSNFSVCFRKKKR